MEPADDRAVRPAGPADLPLLPALERAADAVFAAVGIDLPPGTVPLEDLQAAELVLVAGSPPAGFTVLERLDDHAHLAQLSVHPGAARRGLGSALLAAAVDAAAARGFPAVTLTTFADVAWNGPFYRRRGFVPLDDPGPQLRRHLADLAWLERYGRREVLVHPLP